MQCSAVSGYRERKPVREKQMLKQANRGRLHLGEREEGGGLVGERPNIDRAERLTGGWARRQDEVRTE